VVSYYWVCAAPQGGAAGVQLDFKDADGNGNFRQKHYHENYGYDLETVLSKHSIKELDNPSHKEDLLNSLKKGNRQSATFIKDGQEVKQYIEASPQFKTLTIYDADHKRLDTRQAKSRNSPKKKATRRSRMQKRDKLPWMMMGLMNEKKRNSAAGHNQCNYESPVCFPWPEPGRPSYRHNPHRDFCRFGPI
jgi:hypothetical protein